MSLVLQVDILGEYKQLTAATKGAQTTLGQLNKRTKAISTSMNRAFAAIGIGFSLAAITRGLGDAIEAAEKVQQSDKRLEQVAKSMALFGAETSGVTSKMKKYADQLELTTGVEAETTKLVQAKLLTFKELGKTATTLGGQFDRATKAALDLAATGFGSAETNAVQLGKALQDPIKGITALARAGVTFTDQEKEKIKTLVESNKMLEAQDLILSAIETQVGGVAEATAKTSDKMRNAFGQIQDALGLALLPLLDEFSTWLATPEGEEKLGQLVDLIKEVVDNFAVAAKWVLDNQDWLVPMVVAIGSVTAAWKLAVAGVEAYRTAVIIAQALGGPAGWVSLGVGALALGAVATASGQGKTSTGQSFSTSFGTVNTSGNKTTVVQNINIKGSQSAEEIAAKLRKAQKSTGSNMGLR